MSVVFRKTKNDYYVISPMGLISPISFVTKSDSEFKRAKIIYNIFFAVTVVLMSWHYREFNDVSHPMKWPSLFGILAGILIFFVYDASNFIFEGRYFPNKETWGNYCQKV